MEKLATYVVREGALSASDAVGWIVRVCATLSPLHMLGIAHGRVTAKAIQIVSPHCDDEGYLLDGRDLVDDAAYYSPERANSDGDKSPEDDTWAVGVTLYRMLTGQLPYPGTTSEQVAEQIAKHDPGPLAIYDVGDDDLQAILNKMFRRDIAERTTELVEVQEALVAWNPALGELPALHFGRPGADEDDDEEEEMTAVYQLRTPPAKKKPKPVINKKPGNALMGRPSSRPPPAKDVAATKERPWPNNADLDQATIDANVRLEGANPSAVLERRPRGPDGPAAKTDAPTIEPADELAIEQVAAAKPGPQPPPPRDTPAAPVGPTSVAPEAAEGGLGSYLLGMLFVFGVAGAGYYFFFQKPPGTPQLPPTTTSTASTAQPAVTTSSVPSSTATGSSSVIPSSSAAPSSSASSSASAASSATPESPGELAACAHEMFPKDTFTSRALSFDFVCTTPNPAKGATKLHANVVLGGGRDKGVTDAMKEWSNLRWYAMAAFAVIRGHCCTDPKPLKTKTTLKVCKLDERLEALGKAANSGGDEAADQAVEEYNKAIYCLARGGTAHLFAQDGLPRGGELETFKRTFRRARKLAK